MVHSYCDIYIICNCHGISYSTNILHNLLFHGFPSFLFCSFPLSLCETPDARTCQEQPAGDKCICLPLPHYKCPSNPHQRGCLYVCLTSKCWQILVYHHVRIFPPVARAQLRYWHCPIARLRLCQVYPLQCQRRLMQSPIGYCFLVSWTPEEPSICHSERLLHDRHQQVWSLHCLADHLSRLCCQALP